MFHGAQLPIMFAVGMANNGPLSMPNRVGHGGTQKDSSGRERHGHQTICPLDHKAKGAITDTEIHSKLVYRLKKASIVHRWLCMLVDTVLHVTHDLPPHPSGLQGVQLHALVDSCHSGTIMNMPYNLNHLQLVNARSNEWEHEYPGLSAQAVRSRLQVSEQMFMC